MATITAIAVINNINNTNPVYTALSLLGVSIIAASISYNSLLSSWLSFVMILTFSSGMLTLFLYTASLAPNENINVSNNSNWAFLVLMLHLSSPTRVENNNNESINSFSSNILMIIITSMLIITMLAVSTHGHHPNQTISASF